ncbi:metallophosphoesterase [Brevibacillus agri]|uniref:metallophosphoesterase n=1 Tax=Brevibacillus agri TaxID=51101 RepID=UPI002E20CB32|nr:metallophosphoesterase [Brevibacillus agri]MED1646463.1 metallophosphoesterase [Brevibacillus agri]MED1652708.1 metallophosphoesterase [Brevibacillus agri]MED1690001.1 metallophosphoesterase [Brevibacillus agri]MED1691315.1 metallophosphoesterase [Brevibacillus agri]MED1700707.1 metallophosphoesterase [Brevibacillus agri]
MRISTQLHTIFMLVGPTECGKTTFATEVLIPQLRIEDAARQLKANVAYISSDDLRQELLGHAYDKYDQVMLEASEQAFSLLFEKLRLVTSFPINAPFVVVDTTGLAEDFRARVCEIARENHYNLEVIVFDYRKREDYYASERSKKLITSHILRLKKEVLRALSKEGYANIHRIRAKDFYEPAEAKANEAYQVVIENKADYLATILIPDTRYIIIGDVHECVHELKRLLAAHGYQLDNNRLVVTDKVRNTKVILAGDWIDKGKQTREIIEFLYDNQEHFLLVRGNHEHFVYHFLQGKIKGVEPELLATYFDSIAVLRDDLLLQQKFNHLCAVSRPFYRCIALANPSYYVTHAPCQNKYIGKLDAVSVRQQRNFRLDRSTSVEEQLGFLREEAVGNHPYHLFGHIAAKQAFRLKNKLHLDTGCVQGNALTSVVMGHKPLYKTERSVHAALVEELPSLFQEQRHVSLQDLAEEELRRLHYCLHNKINFISGTMPPADKDEAAGELESLWAGLRYFAERGARQVVLQPKYMGSRCNLYLHRELAHCFAVSRNGYKITQVDLTPIYAKLLDKFGPYMEEQQVKMLLLDGELLPWRAIGEGLIEKQFKPIEKALHSELSYLQEHGFEQALRKLVDEYEASGFEQDQFHLAKSALTEKYGSTLYQNYKHVREIKETLVPIEQQMAAYATYEQQLALYGEPGELEYKPFAVLKLVYETGEEQLPDWRTSEMYRFVSEDDCLVVDLDEADAYEQAARFFAKTTLEQQMEGIVIKPEVLNEKTVPAMKVRNSDYLSIIYGYDYRFPHKYRKLMKQKNIGQKLRTAMKEHELGKSMLLVKFADISPAHEAYQQTVATMLFEVAQEKEIDPRL